MAGRAVGTGGRTLADKGTDRVQSKAVESAAAGQTVTLGVTARVAGELRRAATRLRAGAPLAAGEPDALASLMEEAAHVLAGGDL